MIIKQRCPVKNCNKIQTEKSSTVSGKYKLIKLECGHSIVVDRIGEAQNKKIVSLDGKEPFSFQYDGIEFAEKSNLRCLIADEMRLGKGSIKSEPILTPSGWSTYGDIQVNQDIIGSDGKSHKVIGKYERGILPIYQVTFSDGSSTIVDGDHLWEVNTPIRKWKGAPSKIIKTKDLIDNLYLTAKAQSGKFNSKWYIPIVAPIEFVDNPLPIEPYVLGLLIGDGSLSTEYRVGFSTADNELMMHLRLGLQDLGCEPEYKSKYDLIINNNATLVRYLKELNLKGTKSNTKFVPDIYKFNSIKNRLAILRGLMDTDGSIWENGVSEFTTVSEQLKDDVVFLVRSLGGIARVTTKDEPKYVYKGETLIGQKCYRIVINISINPFRISRKRDKWQPNTKFKPTRAIISIEPKGMEEVICISTSAPNQLYVTRDFIVTHNTVQALGAFKRHPEAQPTIIIVKAALTEQWSREVVRWQGPENVGQIIKTPKDMIFPGLKNYILSFDILPRLDIENLLKVTQAKSVIIDECQMIKNRESKRCKAVQSLVAGKIARKRVFAENLERNKRITMIAKDLMQYHGVSDRFTLNFEELGENKLGLCECKPSGDGRIIGRITIDKAHAENDDESEVIDSITHEISHAITPGAGHRAIWSQTDLDIGGTGLAQSWCDGTVNFIEMFEAPKHLIALSGTPIKNSAAEYFPILNMLDPRNFGNFNAFASFLDGYNSAYGAKFGGIKSWRHDEFKALTAPYIIRRERKDVMPDLPMINRTFFHTEMGEIVEKMYADMQRQFNKVYDEIGESKKIEDRGAILAFISKMRHITGIAKIDPCVDWVSEYLFETDRKLTIFVHHQDVGEMLFRKIDELCIGGGFMRPLKYVSAMDTDERQKVVDEFTKGKTRILVASTQAAGEGVTLYPCDEFILLERQWNPANEEQAEARGIHPESKATQINATYFLATGTIDEYFTELVEKKRGVMKQTVGGIVGANSGWQEEGLMRELAEIIRNKGGKKWKL